MTFFSIIFQWINIVGIYLLIDSILLRTEKKTPKYAKERLEGIELDLWREARFFAHITMAIGFYAFTFSENLPLDVMTALIINIIGLFLIFLGQFISIRNNIRKIGKWSSTI
jgi:predicted transporter